MKFFRCLILTLSGVLWGCVVGQPTYEVAGVNHYANEAEAALIADAATKRVHGQPVTILKAVVPSYPYEANRQRIEGEVSVLITVNGDGSVGAITIVRSAHPLLADATREAMRQWRFKPFVMDGKPVSVQLEYTSHFAR